MCGIHCIVDFTGKDLREKVFAMAKSTIHRGLDAPETLQIATQNYNIALGHNLLPISSPKEAKQPFSDTQGRYHLVFNGEIYNRKEIDKKHQFSNFSQSDTETLFNYLLALTEKKAVWGDLEGIFAFIFFDVQQNLLLTARDTHGIKPLYCYQNQQNILFSSEIGAFWASGQVSKKIRKEAVSEYLSFKFPLRPCTFFEDIEEHPTCLQIWDLQAKSKEQITRSTPAATLQFDSKRVVNDTENLLLQAVKSQYSSFYPPALMLSGGLDSTLLLALAHKQNLELPAFSIITDQHQFTKDADFAQKAAKTFQTPLEKIYIDASLLDNLPEILSKADYPIADTAILPTYLIAQRAKKQNFRVLWSGAGADELFAGYHRHQAYYTYLKNPKIWNFFAQILKKLPINNRLFVKFLQNIHPNQWQTFLNFASMEIEKIKLNKFENQSFLQKALQWDKENYLFSDLLKINDFWTMQATIELRVPYLDEKLIQFTEQIPAEFLLKKGRKWILKEILGKMGGKSFAQRRKEGFGIPFGHWIRQQKYYHLFSFINNSEHSLWGFVDAKRINEMWLAHQNLQADYTTELFAIYFLALWLERQ